MSKIIMLTLVLMAATLNLAVNATAGQLSLSEEAHLIFMRSEEKLARDVYLTLGEMYPKQPVFNTIATLSEQRHTDTMRDLLIKFRIDDPEPNADEPGYIGVFESPYFDFYFMGKFDFLIGKAADLLSALKVGALIEELDMEDINFCNDTIYEVFQLDGGTPCGLTATDVRALENTLENLLAGSENHLCAFISQIGPIAPACYESHYLTQHEVWDIINEQCSEFLGYVCQPND